MADVLHYIGLDVHKKTIAYCIKLADRIVVSRGTDKATSAVSLATVFQFRPIWSGEQRLTECEWKV